jgi:hypothetical protein
LLLGDRFGPPAQSGYALGLVILAGHQTPLFAAASAKIVSLEERCLRSRH